MSRSEAWRKKQSEGVKRAWAEGKYVGKNRPDYSAISAKTKGRKRHPEEIEKARAGIKAAWERGVYDKPETLKKRMDHIRSLKPVGRPPEHMAKIREMRDMDKMKVRNSQMMRELIVKMKESGQYQQLCDARSVKLKNGHGLGKNQRGSLEHSHAKTWKVRDPFGKEYEFINLREWARQNEHLFEDDRPESRMPFAARIAAGLKNIHRPRKPNAPTHYKGWTVVDSMYKTDLLDRESATVLTDPT